MSGPRPLPIDPLLPGIERAVAESGALVLTAEPGAGKTTRVPPALLEATKSGEVLVLEPRRLAARLAAERVAQERGERAGETVGWKTRFEERSGPRTRLRFLTEGILARRLLRDPLLEGVSAVVLDEFHERHLDADLALALLARLRRTSRPDLRIVVMSATLDAGPVAEFLEAPVLSAPGRSFDVAIEHDDIAGSSPLEERVRAALERLLASGLDGDVLVFLPGAGEIRAALDACEDLAREHDLALLPLHGRLSSEEQDRALRPLPRRRAIFATNVAETSITIEGVSAVIDSGLARVAGCSSWSGLPVLEVEPISRASAKQRAGRAGRTRAGRCVRLYSKEDLEARPAFASPEIARDDLAETVLSLRAVGIDPASLAWLERPPSHALETASALLAKLGALDARAGVTALGKRLLAFPLHPRLARIVVDAEERGVGAEACAIAALLSERSIGAFSLEGRSLSGKKNDEGRDGVSDILDLLDRFEAARRADFAPRELSAVGVDPNAARATFAVSRDLARHLRQESRASGLSGSEKETALLKAILSGNPDRVASRRTNARGKAESELLLQDGRTARLARESRMRSARFLVAVDAQERKGSEPLVRLASAIEPEWLIDAFPESVRETALATWDARAERVQVATRLLYGSLVLDESARGGDAPAVREEAGRVLAHAALAAGPEKFASRESLDFLAFRTFFAHSLDARVPELGDAEARETLAELASTRRSFAELKEADLLAALTARLGHEERRALDRLAPAEVVLAGGRRVRVRYARGQAPWIESRLQDFFGVTRGPSAGGKPLVLHLLAPNGRAVQITTDLAGFWEKHYPAIRRELSRRYPKHAWPEDPIHAKPPPPGGKRRRG